MEKEFQTIWNAAVVYLRQAPKKDFVLHTKWVVKSMEMLLEKEEGERRVLIPAAILHDTGWAEVPLELQMAMEGDAAKKALVLHLKNAVPIARRILKYQGYAQEEIEKITGIILSHKFANPRNSEKRLLIDADALADIFKEPFYADAKYYKKTLKELLEFRKQNRFYTKTARAIFDRESEKREREIAD
jgi:hypothetical protein